MSNKRYTRSLFIRNSHGFTLVELLIVITIMASLLSLGLASFTSFNKRERLKQAALTLKATLRFAQTKSISSEKPASDCTQFVGLRVSFTSENYSTQHECSPEGLVGTVDTVTLPVGVTFDPIPSSFTYLTHSNSVNLDSDQSLILTNTTQNYALRVSPNGNISDEGFQ